MSDKPEWVYVTKYALTDGIRRVSVKTHWGDRRVTVSGIWHSIGPQDYATDWPAAVAQAEAKRAKKIASLKKSITKLERMTWTEPTTPTATSSGEAG